MMTFLKGYNDYLLNVLMIDPVNNDYFDDASWINLWNFPNLNAKIQNLVMLFLDYGELNVTLT